MSGNAALASARRRRGEEPMAQNNSNQKSNNANNMANPNQVYSNNLHPLKCVLNHDKQIWVLERQVEQIIDNMNNNDNTNDNSLVHEQNNSEIKLLKSTIQKQQKSIQELNTLVTNLKANSLNNENMVNDLSNKFDMINSSPNTNDTKNTKNTNNNLEKKSTIKFDISEK